MTAIQDIAAERARQISVEGWTAAHDDEHENGALALAAAAYALNTTQADPANLQEQIVRAIWPWNSRWWKPRNPRRDLVRAGALIVAEIERLDRKAAALKAKS